MGIYLSIFRWGSVSNNYLTPILANENLWYAFLVGLFFLTVSFISGIIFVFLEKRAIQSDHRGLTIHFMHAFSIKLIKKFNFQFWFIWLNIMFAYISLEGFYDILKEFLIAKFNTFDGQMSTISSLNYIVVIIFAPIFGHL